MFDGKKQNIPNTALSFKWGCADMNISTESPGGSIAAASRFQPRNKPAGRLRG